jgi:two-component sensor histidine kinase
LPLQRAAQGADIRGDEIECSFSDRTVAHLLVNASPLYDPQGQVAGAVAIGVDVTARAKADRERALLIHELNHRVKNTLATVQSIAMQTMRGGGDTTEQLRQFEARLGALSRAHDLLTLQNWEYANLRTALERALEPFGAVGSRFRLDGPDATLSPRHALSFSMALHELATNAVKYGALSNDTGYVRLEWQNISDAIAFTWEERDGPPVVPPTRRGFGTRLLERALAHDLGAPASLEFLAAGLVADLVIPVAGTGPEMETP